LKVPRHTPHKRAAPVSCSSGGISKLFAKQLALSSVQQVAMLLLDFEKGINGRAFQYTNVNTLVSQKRVTRNYSQYNRVSATTSGF